MRHRTAAAATVLALATVLAGCGSDDPGDDPGTAAPSEPSSSAPAEPATTPAEESSPAEPTTSPPEPAPEPAEITISSFTYEVPETVAPGQTISVTNEDAVLHTVTADGAGGFDVPVPAGETVEFTAPSEPGDYPFFCDPHPYMTATLVVG